MATLRDIKQRIGAVENTSKITSAMKMVSAAKLKRSQSAIQDARPYFQKLDEVTSRLISSVGDSYSHPLLVFPNEVKKIVIVAIAGDKGLCGSFNNNLFKYTDEVISGLKSKYPAVETLIIPVGKKCVDYYEKHHYNIGKTFPGVFKKLEFSLVKEITDTFESDFIKGKIGSVLVVYNEFVSMISQKPHDAQLLPVEKLTIKPQEKMEEMTANDDYIFEPSQPEILDYLLPTNLKLQLWRALLESNAAENAARMLAMDTATNNAKDLMRFLNHEYNKARQTAITNEMLEIVSGADALKSN